MKKLFWLIIKLLRKLLGISILGLNGLSLALLFIGVSIVNLELMLVGALGGYVFSFPLIYLHIVELLFDKPKYNPYTDINNDITSYYANYKYYGGKKNLDQFTFWLYSLNYNEIERLDEAEKFLIETIKGRKSK